MIHTEALLLEKVAGEHVHVYITKCCQLARYEERIAGLVLKPSHIYCSGNNIE